ncbi:MAG: lysophospholipid acyltransferase family protein [Omnitrophica WOR_2 bacterium]
MDIYYSTAKMILWIYLHTLAQSYHASGELPLPQGPKIIAANHPNATDAFYLPFVFQEKLHYFIQGNIFSVPFIGWLLEKSRQIPVWPGRGKVSLTEACRLLKAGKTVVIFPEGRLNPDGIPVNVHTGAIRLSLMSGAAIIPVGFYVPAQHLRNIIVKVKDRARQGRWQTGGRCYIRVGSSWQPEQEFGKKLNKTSAHELTARLMEKIEALADLANLEWEQENHMLLPGISD